MRSEETNRGRRREEIDVRHGERCVEERGKEGKRGKEKRSESQRERSKVDGPKG